MDTTGEITVAIPSYNYAQYLTEAVMSAVEQEGVKLDVVIVDNASTDGSLHLARELAEQHDCVRVVAHPDNQGIVSSFNRCLDEVRGEYSVMLSADDCLAPGSLLRSARFMRANANVGLVYGPIVHFSSLSDLTPRQVTGRAREAIVYPGHDWIDRRCHVGTNPIRAPEAFVRTAARRKVGKYDPSFPFTFDLHMWLRLALISDVGYLPGPAQAFYRVHNLNFAKARFGTPLPDLEQHWAVFASFFDQLDGTAEAQQWREVTRATISKRARWAAARAYAAPPGSPKAEEVDDLLAMARRVSGEDLSNLEALNWNVHRRIGRRWARFYPPFVMRLAARGARRYVYDKRHVRTGV